MSNLFEEPDSCKDIAQLVPEQLGAARNAVGPLALGHCLVVVAVGHGVRVDSTSVGKLLYLQEYIMFTKKPV